MPYKCNLYLLLLVGPRRAIDKVSACGIGGLQARNPIPPKVHRVWSLLRAKSPVVANRPHADAARNLGEGVPFQASLSSSNHGSKLRSPFQHTQGRPEGVRKVRGHKALSFQTAPRHRQILQNENELH
ncbi:hypothetical protein AVEN_54405-1 [Araneus ventricosus]|uniref:Uncharacterized protein n=1 Tax=Araneus ventricosus TaxID=182803 RepID=A0A4Y2DCW3_ARAVE|nr:hypothetical protein AVEN_54405-1 [Araneus ventricosus]